MHLLSETANAKLLAFNKNEIALETNDFKRKYIEGGWLEYLTYRCILELRQEIPKIQDLAMGFRSQNETIIDEIDVIFLANNQLFIIECKTGENANPNHHLQRLDSLRKRLGGVISHAAYISTLAPGRIKGNLQKADALNVLILGDQDLPSLKTHLKT